MRRYPRRSYGGTSGSASASQIIGIVIALPLAAIIFWFFRNPGVFSKVQVIVTHNIGFWFTSVCGVAYAFWHKWRNPVQFSWLEVPVQIVVTIFSLFMFYSFFFYSTTDLKDREIWNSRVTVAEYYEEWTEEVCQEVCDATDDEGNCTSTHMECHDVYHPPSWNIVTDSKETIDINQGHYRQYVKTFGGEKKENLFHAGQVSIGDGDRFYVICDGQILPTANEHSFVNYLKGSQSIKKRVGASTKGFEKFLADYPSVRSGPYGPIEFDRVIYRQAPVTKSWAEELDAKLEQALAYLGKTKQVNVMVYLVGSADQSFTHALEAHWVNGKKNDVIVIIGAPNFPEVSWASVLAWTEVEEFKVALRNSILDMGSLDGKATELAQVITEQIRLPGEKGGFVRKPMAELVYLASDVSLPWWSQLLVVMISGFLAWLCSWALSNNDITE